MANETIKILSARATERTIEIRVALFDESGLLLTDQIYDSLESDGSQADEQILAFAKRKAILYLQKEAILKNIIEEKIKTLPEIIDITAEDLIKTDPMNLSAVKTK